MVKLFARLLLCSAFALVGSVASAQQYGVEHVTRIIFTSSSGIQILTGSADPTSGGGTTTPNPPVGSYYLRSGTAGLYQKTGSGATAWTLMATGGTAAPAASTYITQTCDATLSAEQCMSALATGIVKNTTTTGVQSIATAGTDYVKPAVGTVGTLIPDADATRDVGTSSARWLTGYFTNLFVGINTPSFVTPTRRIDVGDTRSGALGSTDYALGKFDMQFSSSGSAYTGTGRAFWFNVGFGGTQNASTEITSLLVTTANGTTGTVTAEHGGLFSIQRSGGPSTGSYSLRADRAYTGAAAHVSLSGGLLITSPTVASSAIVDFSRGIQLQDQTLAGATNSIQIQSQTSGTSEQRWWSDGSTQFFKDHWGTAPSNGQQALHAYNATWDGGDPSMFSDLIHGSLSITPTTNITKGIGTAFFENNPGGSHSSSAMTFGVYGADYPTDTFSHTGADGVGAGVIGEVWTNSTATITRLTSSFWQLGLDAATAVTTLSEAYYQTPYQMDSAPTNYNTIDIENQTWSGLAIANNWAIKYAAPLGTVGLRADGLIKSLTSTVANLPTCNSAAEGSQMAVTNSTTNTWGATITGTGALHVLGYCDGTNWTVMGK